jgi:ATP-dependent protease HslVU (ClpYQ) peptidase subunit
MIFMEWKKYTRKNIDAQYKIEEGYLYLKVKQTDIKKLTNVKSLIGFLGGTILGFLLADLMKDC